MKSFNNFLDESCSKFDTMLICRDLNLPKISWDPSKHLSGANKLTFTQHNTIPTYGNDILDLVISSVPDRMSAIEVVKPSDAEMFIDHSVVCFEFQTALKAKPKIKRYVHDYKKGDILLDCALFYEQQICQV